MNPADRISFSVLGGSVAKPQRLTTPIAGDPPHGREQKESGFTRSTLMMDPVNDYWIPVVKKFHAIA